MIAATAVAAGTLSLGGHVPAFTQAQPAAVPQAEGSAEWSYTGPTGPEHWADLGYRTCGTGRAQSPVDVTRPRGGRGDSLRIQYSAKSFKLSDTGHAVNAEPVGGGASGIVLDGKRYELLQFHVHAPSEHQVNGLHYPAEVHFVHGSADGRLAVVGAFIKAGP